MTEAPHPLFRAIRRLALKYRPLPRKDVAWFASVKLNIDTPVHPQCFITYYVKVHDDSDRGYCLGMELATLYFQILPSGKLSKRVSLIGREYVGRILPAYTIVWPKGQREKVTI